MKRIVLGFALLLSSLSLFSQVKNKKYDLYLLETPKIGGPTAYQTGVYLSNDTLYVDFSAFANVISIHSEDSSWNSIFIYPYRKFKRNPLGAGQITPGTFPAIIPVQTGDTGTMVPLKPTTLKKTN